MNSFPLFEMHKRKPGAAKKFVTVKRFRAAGDRTRPRFTGRKAVFNGELKFHDLDIDDAVVATGGTIAEDSVLTIVQGTTESQRIGRKVQVHQINWRFKIAIPATQTPGDTADIVRVILYQDKQTNGAAAGVLDIVETADYQSFNNLANKSRFRTLMDRTYAIQSIGGAGNDAGESGINFGEGILEDTLFKKVNIGIEYDNSATTGAITTMRSSNIGVLLLGFSGLAGFSSKMRIRYSDGG